MYLSLFVVLIGAGIWLLYRGWRGARKWMLALGAAISLSGLLLPFVLELWGDALWFDALGYGTRFWTLLAVQAAAVTGGATIGLLGVYLLTWSIERKTTRYFPELAGAALGVIWGLRSWHELLLFVFRVDTDLHEPVLGQDTGFYLFTLPLLDRLHDLLFWIVLISLLAALASLFVQAGSKPNEFRLRSTPAGTARKLRPFWFSITALAVVLAGGRVLDAYHLLYANYGVVTGPGWTDVHVRLPAYLLLAAVILLLGCAALLPAVRGHCSRWAKHIAPALPPPMAAPVTLWAGIALIWLIALGITPMLVQGLLVEPNEITYERPYIANNIRFTRHGFGLHDVDERRFPVADALDRQTVENNRTLLDNVRLWDWRALDAVYKQFQEIRLYYEFADVDVDRYTIDGEYRQVMVSAREMAQSNLAPQSQTFVNRRFKFTHGYGLTLTSVSDFTDQGLPRLLIKDIPPQSSTPSLRVDEPRIYYGELTRDPVVVNSSEQEFDYPSGDANVYNRYAGDGGVRLGNVWRKFVFGWKFDGTRFLLSSYPTADSRVMFKRQIRERVATLAPFLTLDQDPYLVLANGRLYWIIDAYTTSSYYPYSEPFASREIIEYENGERRRRVGGSVVPDLRGVNYLRNSVKVVVDAYQGSVDFYVFEPTDPLIQAWGSVFPELFRPSTAMPAELRAHVRYPVGLLLAQGLVYAKYHMEDPAVFYNQEDLWVRATEKYYDAVQPVEPYYVMWQLPEADQAEFVLILPFTPKNRQVLIGWIAGLSDGDNYGRFLAYKFPKEKRILGPQQVETKIDQDRFLSGQLTLWDQRGSNVIRGNVLAIPIADTLLYVEPIYLQAETAAYPELRLMVVMRGDRMSYAETFDEALRGLFAEQQPDISGRSATGSADASLAELARQANQAFEDYLRRQGEGQFQQAAQALSKLQELLQRLSASQPLPSNPAADTTARDSTPVPGDVGETWGTDAAPGTGRTALP